jgi:hypothetical protein
MTSHVTQVGAPDPELRNSPIFDEYEDVSLDMELETGACYFNNTLYPVGQYLLSGSELLHCELRSIWVRKGELRPE